MIDKALKLTISRCRYILSAFVAAALVLVGTPLVAGATDSVIETVFYEDNGIVCTIFVSVMEEKIQSPNSARHQAWSSLNAGGFDVCDATEPTELGVITVRGIDEYRQPDWSRTIEHMYFEIKGWDKLKAACDTATPLEQCAARLESVLVESSN